MRSPSPPDMTSKVSSSAALAREKCSRNKRKFRQDPPFPNQGTGEENLSGENALSSEGDNSWMSEPRSVEVTPAKSPSAADSSHKESDSGHSSASTGKNETARFYQEHLKLMRLFRSGQGKVPQPAIGGTTVQGKLEQPGEEGRNKAPSETSCEDDEEFYELEEVDWDDCTEGELEDLLVKSLGSLYNEAINKIVANGNTAEEAVRAVLKQGRCHGSKDAVSNIVENALAYLAGNKHASEGRDHSFSDLKELQKYGLAEMIGLLREVRPLLSKGDAMWCLLMCDMNVALARVMDDASLPPAIKEPLSGQVTIHSGPAKVASTPSPRLPPPSDPHLPTNSAPNLSSLPSMHPPASTLAIPPASTLSHCMPSPPSPATVSHSESPSPAPVVSIPDIAHLSLSDSTDNSVSRSHCDTSSNSEEFTSDGSVQAPKPPSLDPCSSSEIGGPENSIQVRVISSSGLDESVDVEPGPSFEPVKNEIVRDSRGTAISKISAEPPSTAESSPGEAEDLAKGDAVEDSGTKEESSSRNTSISGVCQQADTSEGTLAADGSEVHDILDSGSSAVGTEIDQKSVDNTGCVRPVDANSIVEVGEAVCTTLELNTAKEPTNNENVERGLTNATPSDADNSSSGDIRVVADKTGQAAKSTITPECLSEETSVAGKRDLDDQKEEMKHIQRVKELETQLQERTEWAKQKVMQAARRLSKDLQELKALRLEREEALRLKKDKQALEDSTMKKLTDLENALRKASGQVDRANASVRKLEAENAEVRAEMEAAKLSAAESQATFQEISKRERKYTKRALAWEKQKAKLQEELSEEKRKITALQQQVVLAKERQQQAEVRWRQEEKAKDEATHRADHEKRTREQAEAAAKRREESLRRKADSNYQRHREDIQRLESEIVQLRTSAEAAQLATSRWGPGVAVTSHMMELGNLHALKEQNIRLSREIAELQDMARRDVRRERECVMCMCEEMAVVFLPCAHQVVCVKCNELHEKQGMRDCPSCRTPIKQRIRVYGVST